MNRQHDHSGIKSILQITLFIFMITTLLNNPVDMCQRPSIKKVIACIRFLCSTDICMDMTHQNSDVMCYVGDVTGSKTWSGQVQSNLLTTQECCMTCYEVIRYPETAYRSMSTGYENVRQV